ncbi:MFS general substrate transporter [Lindgomyces ingoldianus]|uniref:MFS general substrate transporter n=1 Tax=Lindgomyces ingoldianus TaxID=673940 RepID=A0ACB6QZT1_9PLEO|nr:MFS general substrate transporter [Lindgomyces ingoldianus]KAF2472513.1 MFS general substrate transporter [Lindgomyces ingoldianus]
MESSSVDLPKLSEKPKIAYIETIERIETADTRCRGPNTFLSQDLKVSANEPTEEYEGRHRYDPNFHWEALEEKKIVRKLDKRVCVWTCLAFFCLLLDRSNTSQAIADNLLDDLKMNTNDYNFGSTLFNITFLIAEIPMQLLAKKIGPDRWLPVQMVAWSIVASCQAFLKNRTGYLICRSLLGITEAGFIPENVLYLSYFYTGAEMAYRMTFFWIAFQASQVISALMAFGILHLRGVAGLPGWRWLFGLEGCITGIIGVIAIFFYPTSPTQPSIYAKLRGPKSWFTENEEKVMVNRILRDDPAKGAMHNREHISFKMMWKATTDWHMVPMYILSLTWTVPFLPMTMYMTLTLRGLGFTTFQTSLMSIPGATLVGLQLFFWAWVSRKTGQTLLLGVIGQLWAIPFLLTLLFLPRHPNPWVKWVICLLLVGYPNILGIMVSLVSRNAGSVRTRALAATVFNMGVHGASIIGFNIYRNDDKPAYHRGNKVLLGFVCLNILMFISAKMLYKWENARRDKIWNAMTDDEKIEYLTNTTDEGNKRLDFRFDH